MSEQTQQETAASEQTRASFSLNDLKGLREIVRVAAERGAFKAEELSAIGGIYDRLNAFLAAGDAASQAEQAEGSEATAETSAEAPQGE